MRANFVMSGVAVGLRRNLTMTIALVLSTAIALAFVGAAILANIEISRFKTDYESKLNVSVFLCSKLTLQPPCKAHKTTDAQTAALRAELQKDSRVASVSYVSEAEQFRRAVQVESPAEAKLNQVGIIPASFTIKLNNVNKDYTPFRDDFLKKPTVSGVSDEAKTIKRLLSVIDGARLFSIVVALVVLIASILMIANTIQVAAAQRRNETSIMRLVGASRWMTELPFMLETIIATAVGGLISFGMVGIGKHFVLDGIFKIQVERNVIPNLGTNDVLIASGVGLISGVVLAALTAFATLRLYVRL